MHSTNSLLLLPLLSSSLAFHLSIISSLRHSPPTKTTKTSLLLSISSYSLAGSDQDRPSKVNQDAFFHQELDHNIVAFGILDGHGLKGHELTRYLSQEFPYILKHCLKLPSTTSQVNDYFPPKLDELKQYQQLLMDIGKDSDVANYNDPLCQAFHLAQLSAMQNPNVPAGRAGTTCIVGVLTNGTTLDICHVGDSRAILLQQHVNSSTLNTATTTAAAATTTIQQLTLETTIKHMPLELSRIQQGEGRVDAFGNVFYGPQGIAMTRSLGNSVMLRAGILPTPILAIEQMLFPKGGSTHNSATTTVVLATDGVWDVLSNEQVRDVLAGVDSFEDSGRVLAEAAKQKWIGDLPIEGRVDDITCIIVQF